MAFRTVPEERMFTDIKKSFMVYFKNDPDFADIDFRVNHPDDTRQWKIPMMSFFLASPNVHLNRLQGYHGKIDLTTPRKTKHLAGPTYSGYMQINLFTDTVGDQDRIVSAINKKLRSVYDHNVFEDKLFKFTEIPLLDFPNSSNISGIATDIKIKFRFHRDIHQFENLVVMAEGLNHYIFSISFWAECLAEYEQPRIERVNISR